MQGIKKCSKQFNVVLIGKFSFKTMDTSNINKIRMSYINDNVKLFIRFCKIHDLYGFIKKYYSSILHLNADLNDRLVSTYVSVLINKEYSIYTLCKITNCNASYLASKKIERDEKIDKLNELWQEFAKEQIKKDNNIFFKKYINKHAASLSNSYYSMYGSDLSQSYSTVHLDRISQQIKSMSRVLPDYYINN